ncbi:MAG: glycosyltransferase family 4 protein [Candidatus Aminicenantes bacterium]|jgi:glycosyltransferase involved in cell wall biosynthesis
MENKNKSFAPLLFSPSDSPPPASQLKEKLEQIKSKSGIQAAYNALMRTQVALGLRKPTLAIYDHTGHIIGGGQKYGFTVAHALQDMFEITLILNKKITHQDILDWYHLDLSACAIKIIEIPFFEQFSSIHLDPVHVNKRTGNPFHIISKESGNYDFFINNSMNEKVYPLANVSAIICHFPERRPKDYFYADRYTYIIYNSQYTAHWIEQKWKFSPHQHIYPPVDMDIGQDQEKSSKENIILSVARFEVGGSKKQLELVYTFLKLNRRFPGLFNQWRLVLAGGSPDENDYLKTIKKVIEKSGAENIQLKLNIPGDELKSLYQRSVIFWHLCGLDQTDPALVEHFGMTIVEAMQNRTVPIVFDGGGQREIVEHGSSGFRVSSTAQLMTFTLKLIREPQLREELGRQAFERSKAFTREVFEKKTRDFFSAELQKYTSV